MEISSKNHVVHAVNSDWEEKLSEELGRVGIYPSSVEIALGQGIVIPPEQPFWYTYCKERNTSNEAPLILLSARGDYVGPTAQSFETKFWDLMVTSDH